MTRGIAEEYLMDHLLIHWAYVYLLCSYHAVSSLPLALSSASLFGSFEICVTAFYLTYHSFPSCCMFSGVILHSGNNPIVKSVLS